MTTLERAARALHCAANADLGVKNPPDFDQMPADDKEIIRSLARAVLMAVREPDEALVSAMNSAAAFHACLEHHSQTDVRMWRAAVDAILNDGEGE